MRLSPKQYQLYRDAEDWYLGLRRTFDGLLTRCPRVVAVNTNCADVSGSANPLLEVVETVADSTGAVSIGQEGLTLLTGDADTDRMALVGACAYATAPNIFMKGIGSSGSAVARNHATSQMAETFKTAASGNIGRGIGGVFILSIPTITTVEVIAGFQGHSTNNGTAIAALGPGASTTRATDGAADGFTFYYHPTDSGNWQIAVRKGSTPATTKTVTNVPVVAGQKYVLEVRLEPDGVPVFKINGEEVGRGAAVDASTVFTPVVGVKTLSAAQRSVVLTDLVPYVE